MELNDMTIFLIYTIVTAFLLVVLHRTIPEKDRNDGWGYAVTFVSIIIWPLMIVPVGFGVILGAAYIGIEWLLNKLIGKPNHE